VPVVTLAMANTPMANTRRCASASASPENHSPSGMAMRTSSQIQRGSIRDSGGSLTSISANRYRRPGRTTMARAAVRVFTSTSASASRVTSA
jgi:hypothetical protein